MSFKRSKLTSKLTVYNLTTLAYAVQKLGIKCSLDSISKVYIVPKIYSM